ncbi:MAG: hypothetical protein PHE26_10895 [Syntrophomonadaceae bacterium]|nr:hypothetical protein [Syntrophomonadaceae bacterium]
MSVKFSTTEKLTTELLEAIKQANIEAAKSIAQTNGLPRIKEQLTSLPGYIREQKYKVAELTQVAKDKKVELMQEEAILASMIAGELDPKTGKAAFSNQAARDAELIIRKKNSPQCMEAEKELQEAETELNNAQFKLEELQDSFRSYRLLARIACTELAIFGGENLEEVNDDVY